MNILIKEAPCGARCLVIAGAPGGVICSVECPWFLVAELYGYRRPPDEITNRAYADARTEGGI
jgi:hypothetical protein